MHKKGNQLLNGKVSGYNFWDAIGLFSKNNFTPGKLLNFVRYFVKFGCFFIISFLIKCSKIIKN